MESANLDPSDRDEEALDALLRRTLSPELPDAGFSARVLAALPPPARRSAGWRQIALCAGGAAAGAAAAFATGHSWQVTLPTDGEVIASVQAAAASMTVPANALTLVIAAAGLLYAWRCGDWRFSR